MRCFDTNLIVIVLHLMIYCYGSKHQHATVKLSMLKFYINSILTAVFFIYDKIGHSIVTIQLIWVDFFALHLF